MFRFKSSSLFLPALGWLSFALIVASNLLLKDHEKGPYVAYVGLAGLASTVGLAERRRINRDSEIERLRTEATTDPLTGIGNRRLLEHELARQIALFRRHGIVFSVLILDIDHFKKLNDTWGHDAGDLMLQSFSRCVSETLRDTDMLFRWGGEEFVAVLTNSDHPMAQIAAERIRAAVEGCTTRYSANELRVTTSIGIAAVEKHDYAESLLKRGDEAVFRAKQLGRNRCESAYPSIPPESEFECGDDIA